MYWIYGMLINDDDDDDDKFSHSSDTGIQNINHDKLLSYPRKSAG
jgi:hypothetical protein